MIKKKQLSYIPERKDTREEYTSNYFPPLHQSFFPLFVLWDPFLKIHVGQWQAIFNTVI